MDEDNNDTPRVTRARTRRMSALEPERPLTPQLDIIAERASPRPTRRTRLNSSTIDLRTPIRSTRLSLARGETPEPITPTASSLSTTKRPTRTPAKSGRKQLTLQEELNEEDASEVAVVETKRTTATAAKSVRKQLTLQEDVKEEPAASTDTVVAVVEAKQSARTPANSVRSQLTIQEDNNEDQVESTDTKMTVVNDVPNVEAKPSARTPAKQAESTDTKMAVVDEVTEVVVESTPTRSGQIANESTPPSDDRRVTRSMSKTPPVHVTRSMSKTPPARGRSANNTPVNTQNSPKMEPRRLNKKPIKDTSVSEQPQMQSTEAINDKSVTEAINDKSVTEPHVEVESMEIDEEEIIDKSKSESNSNVNESLVIATTPKVILIEQNIPEQMKDLNEIIPQNEEPTESESNKENIQHFDEISVEIKDKIDSKSPSVDVEEKLELNSPPSTVATEELYQLEALFVNDDVGANITVTDDIRLTDVATVTKVIRLPDLTPTTKGLLMEQSSGSESRKTVAFNDGMHVDDDAKPKYPKTPARLNEPPVKSVNLITGKNENETPLKRLLKGRNSSTPVTKSQDLLSQADDEPKTPPLQIDVIQPFSALKDEDNNISLDLPITTAKLSRRLLSEDENEVEAENNTYGNRSVRCSDDEYDEAEDATSSDRSNCEFFDMEAEVIEDYQSGDSMNSSERREVVENEIPHDGESVGSQDTPDEHSEEGDSAEEKMSFIVTDSEEGADDDEDGEDDGDAENDNDGGDIECLCFSSASDDDVFDPDEDKPKKYRRIISNDSSDDNDDDDEQINNMEIKTDDIEVKGTEKQVNKSVSSVEEDEDEKQLPIKKTSNTIESEKAEITEDVKLNGEDEEMEVEELLFSSDDENESPKPKKNISNNKSIYEVLDSCDDESDQLNKTAGPIADDLNLTAEKEKPSEPNKKPPVLDDEKPLSTSNNNEPLSSESVATVHEKQKRSGEEEALLAEISSCDLSHLHQMFNPLQKSRRQTLYVQDVPVITKEPKLKRRSVQLNSDVQPSQSFIETLAEEKRQQSKRKHMSKSFCGAADDDSLDVSGDVVEEVQRKKARKSYDPSEVARIDIIEPGVEAAKDEAKLLPSKEENEELPAAQAQEEDNMPVAEDEPELETKLTPTKDVMKSSPVSKMDTNENQPDQKNRNFYLDYCDSILQAANEAKLQQKKQRVASNKKIKRERPASVADDAIDTKASTSTVHLEKSKKDLKRLQATKQAIKHAVQLLVPEKAITSTFTATLKLEKVKIEKDLERLQALKQAVPEIANRPASVTGDAIETTPSTSTATVSLEKAKIKKDLKRLQANKPPVKQLLVPETTNQPQQSQSLARKLSSQPEAKTKTKRKLNKKKKQKVLTLLSSDEESRNGPYHFKNNAGTVTVIKCSEDGSSEDDDIITNSGIVKVEPCTPMSKYFKEIPVTPVGLGFRSEQIKKKPKAEHSAATAAALRFKMKMFGGDK